MYSSGCIIDGFSPEKNIDALITTIKAFDCTAIVVIDSEKTYRELEKKIKGRPILKIPKLFGADSAIITSAEQMQLFLKDRLLSYFKGSHYRYKLHQKSLNIEKYKLLKISSKMA